MSVTYCTIRTFCAQQLRGHCIAIAGALICEVLCNRILQSLFPVMYTYTLVFTIMYDQCFWCSNPTNGYTTQREIFCFKVDFIFHWKYKSAQYNKSDFFKTIISEHFITYHSFLRMLSVLAWTTIMPCLKCYDIQSEKLNKRTFPSCRFANSPAIGCILLSFEKKSFK